MPDFNKDFYAYIPLWMETQLNALSFKYSHEPWFADAWNEFRKLCFSSSVRDIPSPTSFFNKFQDTSMASSEDAGVTFSEDDTAEILIGADDIQLPEQAEPDEFLAGEVLSNEPVNLDLDGVQTEFTFDSAETPEE